TATAFYALAVFYAPGVGLVARLRARRLQRVRIQAEDDLKALHKDTFGTGQDPRTFAERLGLSDGVTQAAVRRLTRKGLVQRDNDGLRLTDAGRRAADELIR